MLNSHQILVWFSCENFFSHINLMRSEFLIPFSSEWYDSHLIPCEKFYSHVINMRHFFLIQFSTHWYEFSFLVLVKFEYWLITMYDPRFIVSVVFSYYSHIDGVTEFSYIQNLVLSSLWWDSLLHSFLHIIMFNESKLYYLHNYGKLSNIFYN